MPVLLAVDVGIVNLAYAVLDDAEVRTFGVVDLTMLRHRRVPRWECGLCHGNSLSDRVAHFVQEHRPLFDDADVVLIEQQPPGGHQAVEQLLYAAFREKAHLVSPTAMHAFYGIRDLDYDGRKAAVEDRVIARLPPELKRALEALERRHDVCDAVCLARFWLCRHYRTPVVPVPRRDMPLAASDDPYAFIAQFAYTGST